MQSSSYAAKVDHVKRNFNDFLTTLPTSPTVLNVFPYDVTRYLVWKDNFGKTQVHCVSCIHLGKKGIFECACPIRLAAGTVYCIVQQLLLIFELAGRGRVWNQVLRSGNPAVSPEVKSYVKAVQEEQARSHIVPKQAKPIFLPKLMSIATYIERQLSRPDISDRERYILLRDQAIFKVQFFAGDRASDVGLIVTQEIWKLKDNSGFVFCHTFGKTLRGDSGRNNTFVLKRCDNKIICPVSAL